MVLIIHASFFVQLIIFFSLNSQLQILHSKFVGHKTVVYKIFILQVKNCCYKNSRWEKFQVNFNFYFTIVGKNTNIYYCKFFLAINNFFLYFYCIFVDCKKILSYSIPKKIDQKYTFPSIKKFQLHKKKCDLLLFFGQICATFSFLFSKERKRLRIKEP